MENTLEFTQYEELDSGLEGIKIKMQDENQSQIPNSEDDRKVSGFSNRIYQLQQKRQQVQDSNTNGKIGFEKLEGMKSPQTSCDTIRKLYPDIQINQRKQKQNKNKLQVPYE